MPYIEPKRRLDLDWKIGIVSDEVMTPGELNYCITRLASLYLKPLIDQGKHVGYDELSGVRRVLQDAADEFYRQVVAPYEDKKRSENGDCYNELR